MTKASIISLVRREKSEHYIVTKNLAYHFLMILATIDHIIAHT